MADALVIVDVQNDFCPGGSLAVTEGDQVVPLCNDYMRRAHEAGMPIFASRDWHPANTRHFNTNGGSWPPHCIQGTWGAQFPPDLRVPAEAMVVSKGTSIEDDGYSMIDAQSPDGRPLVGVLRDAGISRMHVGGLATDYCVRATVLDALKAGLQVAVLSDACRAVNLQPGDGQKALDEMGAAGATFETLETFPS